MLVLTPALTIVSVPVGGLNLMVVPVGAAVKLLGPKREPDVLPKGLEVVFVVPKSPPLLVLVPKFPKPVGLFCANALFWDEKRLVPVLAVPNKLFDVPVDVPNPNPVLVEVAGWLNELVPNNPPGLVCEFPNKPPVLLLEPNADVPNAPPLVVPKPVFCPNVDVVPKPPVLPPKGVPNDLLNIFKASVCFRKSGASGVRAQVRPSPAAQDRKSVV